MTETLWVGVEVCEAMSLGFCILHSEVSRPFDRSESGRIAVKTINHLGDEVMKVFRV